MGFLAGCWHILWKRFSVEVRAKGNEFVRKWAATKEVKQFVYSTMVLEPTKVK